MVKSRRGVGVQGVWYIDSMFSLLRGLWQYLFRKDECFVVIVGLENAGKTVSESIIEILRAVFPTDVPGDDKAHVHGELSGHAAGENHLHRGSER